MNSTMQPSDDGFFSKASESSVSVMHVVYALYAIGLFTAGVLVVVGLIVTYVRADHTAGSFLASHTNWLQRSFWWGMGGALGCSIVAAALASAFGSAALLFAAVPWIVAWLWLAYRTGRGWLALLNGQPIR